MDSQRWCPAEAASYRSRGHGLDPRHSAKSMNKSKELLSLLSSKIFMEGRYGRTGQTKPGLLPIYSHLIINLKELFLQEFQSTPVYPSSLYPFTRVSLVRLNAA